MNKRSENFLNKASKKFGDRFDYSMVEYIDSVTEIKIRCKKHDIIFEQKPVVHLRGNGNGCKFCNPVSKKTTESFIEEAKLVHGDKYDYSLIEYNGATTKVDIKCNIHGIFKQTPNNHLNGYGCPKCGLIKKTSSNNSFIKKAIEIHGNKYDYTRVNYIKNNIKVKIICPEHGEFEQIPSGHLRGKGCPKCGKNISKQKITSSLDDFVRKAKEIHGDKYEYSKSNYVNSTTKINIICPEHGEFEQLPYDHLSGHGCEKCISTVSSIENEVNDFINSLGIETKQSLRTIISPYQIDIFIPSHNIAIEINGLFWHNEQHLNKNYHLNKTILCDKKNIQLIHIFEDEWLFKKNIVKSRLINILKLTKNKIYARNCIIKNITTNDAKIFLNNNHLQGNVNAKIKLGLYYNDNIVALMCFTRPRLGIGKLHDGYELSRFCNILNTTVIGAANKLLKHFIKTYNPKQIISYADRRWSNGQLYQKLGFEFGGNNPPNYWYIVGKERKHRFNFRKDILVKNGFDKNKTEHKIMLERGIYRIYDCGTKRYFLTF